MQPGFQTHLLVWYCGNTGTGTLHVRVWNTKVELKCVGANRLFVCVWSKNQANNHCNNPILLSLAGRWSRIPFVRIPIFKVLCLFLVLEAKSHLFEIPFYREHTVHVEWHSAAGEKKSEYTFGSARNHRFLMFWVFWDTSGKPLIPKFQKNP